MFVIGLLSGLLGGGFGGLLGLGGGIVMIPLMTWLAKMTQHQAHGTSLVAIFFTAVAGSWTYYGHGGANVKVAFILAVTSTVTARLGARFAHKLPERRLRRAFGFFLVFASFMLVTRGCLPKTEWVLNQWLSVTTFLVIGSVSGFVSGMMGVGGGGVMVPLMVVLGNMGQHVAQGTSLLAMIPASLSGALTHYKLGNVKLDIGWGLAAGSLLGAPIGALAANLLPEFYLQLVFASIGIWMGMRYIEIGIRHASGNGGRK